MSIKERRNELRNFANTLGLCRSCFCNEKRDGKNSCQQCSASNVKYMNKRRLLKGYCSRCARKKDDDNFKTCQKCRQATPEQKDYNRKYYKNVIKPKRQANKLNIKL